MNANLNYLPKEVLSKIGIYLNPSEAFAMANVNTTIKKNCFDLVKEKYQSIFGEIDPNYALDNTILASFFNYQNQEKVFNQNIFEVPSSFFDRWKWMLGFENNLDKEVQDIYLNRISLLNNTQPVTILQFDNLQKAFWNTHGLLKDYKKFKKEEIAKSLNGSMLICRIFLNCVSFVLSKLLNPSTQVTKVNLSDMLKNTFAKIGSFDVDDKKYEVIASNILHSRWKIMTSIELYEKSQGLQPCPQTPNVSRIKIKRGVLHAFSSFVNSTKDPSGSDRIVDQKITQLIIELAMQNKNISYISVTSSGDELPVLTAGGFNHTQKESLINDLTNFRAIKGNNLFPPMKDYELTVTRLDTCNLNDKNVYYSKGDPESWSNIIARKAILNTNAGILPEYWAKESNPITKYTEYQEN